jgi:hypothetical protein
MFDLDPVRSQPKTFYVDQIYRGNNPNPFNFDQLFQDFISGSNMGIISGSVGSISPGFVYKSQVLGFAKEYLEKAQIKFRYFGITDTKAIDLIDDSNFDFQIATDYLELQTLQDIDKLEQLMSSNWKLM